MRTAAGMRLAMSLLSAVVLHGVAFGVAAVVLSGEPMGPAPAPAPLDVDVVEVTPPRPDPIADEAPRPAVVPARLVSPAPAHHRWRETTPAPEVPTASEPTLVDHRAAPAPGPSVATPPTAAPAGAPTASHAPVMASSAGAAVSARPRYRSNPKPEYPLNNRRRHEEGLVVLSVLVQPDGLPGKVSLDRSSGYDALDRAALEVVRRRWTFEPARTATGVAVEDTVPVYIRFSLSDAP